MRQYPKISVISIIYKVEPYLRESIESMINQTYKELEIVLVVGTGGDRCMEIAREYEAKDSRIKVVPCEPKGTGDARNRGLEAATGEYIGFVDGDDYASPEMFEKLFLNLEKYEADIAVCGKYSEYPGCSVPDEQKPLRQMSSKDAFEMILKGTGFFFHCWDKLFKASLFEGISFPTDRYLEDRYVVNILLERADKIVYDTQPLYHFRVRSDSLSRVDEMAEYNTDADMDFADYVLKRYPDLKNAAEAFLLYDHLTCIQNRLIHGTFTAENTAKHYDYIREHKGNMKFNPLVDFRVKLKVFLALHMKWALKKITQRSVRKAAENEKFHIS